MLRKDNIEWVKKCIDFVVESVSPREHETWWKEVVEGDVKTLEFSKEDASVRSKWRRLIRGTEKDSDDSGG